MPGRPRLYPDDAARQREYRARRQEQLRRETDRRTRLQASLQRLREALTGAAAAGDPLATRVLHPGINELLEGLAAHFEAVAARVAMPAEPPQRRSPRQKGREG